MLLEHLQQLETSYIETTTSEVLKAGINAGFSTNPTPGVSALDDHYHAKYHQSRMSCLVSDNSFALLRARELKKFIEDEFEQLKPGSRPFRRGPSKVDDGE